MDFLQELSKKLAYKYDFLKVLKVVYNTTFSFCQINFIYPQDLPLLTDSQKEEIKEAVVGILPINTKIECKFNKSFLDENLVKVKIMEFLSVNFSSLHSCINENYISYQKDLNTITLTFNVNETIFNYIENNEIKSKLKNYLTENFCASFIIESRLDNRDDFDECQLDVRAEKAHKLVATGAQTARYEVTNVFQIFGGDILPMPEFIKLQSGNKENVILAGYIKNLEEKEYLPKKNREMGIDEKRKMYKFKLVDPSGEIDCVHFCSKSSQKQFATLQQDKAILCLGHINNNYQNTLQYSIKAISYCSIGDVKPPQEQESQAVEIEDEQSGEYKYVHPKPYYQAVQDNLFATAINYPDFIMNNTFVVFDVETTGISPERCDITEIGAVKVVGGQIKETFQTLCKPHRPIPADVTKLTGITNDMVENERYSEEVIGDFLKFSEGAIMVGYNVEFDQIFIQVSAQRVNKYFYNEFKDCMAEARLKLFLPNFKLKTVVNSLNLNLDNAHRALFDAMATAQAYLKLSTIPLPSRS